MTDPKVTLRLLADANGMVRGVAKGASEVDAALRTTEQNAKARLAGIERGFRTAGAAIGVAIAAAGVATATAVKLAIDSADELSKTSQKIGISTESLSALAYAAELADVSLGQLQGGASQLVNRMGEAAQGNKEYAATFSAIDVALKNSDGTLRDFDDVLGDVADVFQRLPDGATKTKLAIDLFGRSGADLIPLLNSGRDGLSEMTDEAKRFGLVISTETGQQAEEFNDQLTRTGAIMRGVWLETLPQLLPQLVSLAETINSQEFRDGFATIINGAITATAKVLELTAGLGNLVRFAGEEVAARLNGPAGDDIIRLEQALDRVQAKLAEERRVSSLFENPNIAPLEQEEARLQRQIKQYRDMAEATATVGAAAAEATAATGGQTTATDELIERLRTLFTDQTAATAAAREAAKAQREAEQATKAYAAALGSLDELAVDQAGVLGDDSLRAAVDYAGEMRKILSLEEALLDAAEKLTDERRLTEDAERRLSTVRTQAHQKYVRELETIAKKAKAASDAAVEGTLKLVDELEGFAYQDARDALDQIGRIGADSFDRMIEGIRDGADAWDVFRIEGARAFKLLAPEIKKMREAGGSLKELFISSDGQPTDLSVTLASFAGLLAAGSKNAGAISGVITGASAGSTFGVWGAVIGAIIGGLAGAASDTSPRLEAATKRFGREQYQTTTPFGSIFTRTQDVSFSARQMAGAIKEFDLAINGFIDSTQRSLITSSLSEFYSRKTHEHASIEEILGDRFRVILGTFDTQIQRLVEEFGTSLEDQVQTLSDLVKFRELDEEGRLLSGTFDRTITILREFQRAGESLGQAYERLANGAMQYGNLIAGVDQQIRFDGLSDYQRGVVQVELAYRNNVRQANDLAKSLGLTGARAEDLAKIEQLRAIQLANLQRSTENLVETFLRGLRLDDALSPLSDRARQFKALDDLRAAAASGDAARATDLAQQVLTIGRSRLASGADYRALYDEVEAILRSIEGPTEDTDLSDIASILFGLPENIARALFEQLYGVATTTPTTPVPQPPGNGLPAPGGPGPFNPNPDIPIVIQSIDQSLARMNALLAEIAANTGVSAESGAALASEVKSGSFRTTAGASAF